MPTFGRTDDGSTNNDMGNVIYGSIFTCPEAGTADSITVRINGKGYAVKCAIYKESDYSLVGVTEERIIPNTGDFTWEQFDFASPPTLENTSYVLVAWASNWTPFRYQTGEGSQREQSISYNSYPDPLVPNSYTGEYAIYCTYSAIAETETFTIDAVLYPSSPIKEFTTDAVLTGLGELNPLHTSGRWILDSNNNIVILRGVNKHGFEDNGNGVWVDATGQNHYGMWDDQWVKDNLDAIASHGFNCVRFVFSVEIWRDNLLNGKDHFKSIVEWADERGIYVILAFWCIQSGGSQDALPYPPYSGAGSDTIIPNETAFEDFWGDVVDEMKTYSNVIFELWNEPHGTSEARTSWFTTQKNVIDEIRDVRGANNLIIVQWNYDIWWQTPTQHNDVTWITDMDMGVRTNIVYSTHAYTDPSSIGVITSKADAINRLDDCEIDQYYNTIPILFGEMGGSITAPDAQARIDGMGYLLEVLNDYNLGFLGWWWHIGAIYRLLDSGTNYPLNAMGQVFADAVIGTTKTFAMDGYLQETFTKTFTTDAVVGVKTTKSYIIDSILKTTSSITFSIDAFLKKLGLTKQFSVDSYLVMPKTFTIDAIIARGERLPLSQRQTFRLKRRGRRRGYGYRDDK